MNHIAQLKPDTSSALASVEAEALILGAVQIDNTLIDRVTSLSPSDFYEPLHGRIWAAITREHQLGRAVTPVTLKPHFDGDEAFRSLGGISYLAQLTADGQGMLALPELVRQIHDFSERRARLAWLESEARSVRDGSVPLAPLQTPPERFAENIETLDLARLSTIHPEPKQFTIPQIAPAGEVTLLTGAGASGKSLLGQQLASALAAGKHTLGLELKRTPTIYLTCEDDVDQLHFRQHKICQALDIPMDVLAGQLHLSSRRGKPDNALAQFAEDGSVYPSPFFGQLAALIGRTGSKAIFLDHVAHLFPGDENQRSEVTGFINLLNRLAGMTGAAIILLGHPNKGGATYSGSTGWLNAVRSQVFLERPKADSHDPDLRTLNVGKANYTAGGELMRFRWLDWAFVRDEDLPADMRDELAEAIAVSGENEAFLACLRTIETQGPGRAVGPSSGPNFAPSRFEGMAQARGYDRKALRRAMDRLYGIRRIESHTFRNTTKGRDVTVIREVAEATPNAFPNTSRTRSPNTPEPGPRTSPPTHPLSKEREGAGPKAAAPTSKGTK